MAWNEFTGIMKRRLLVNWRVDPEAMRRVLPPGVTPKLVNGSAIAGLCLVALQRLRPRGVPEFLGIASENLAVRTGVVTRSRMGVDGAVLIFDRYSGSRVNAALGHLVGYGIHERGRFHVAENRLLTEISIRALAGSAIAHVRLAPTHALATESIFGSVEQASDFFRGGECGYSPTPRPGIWDCVRLHLERWDFEPMRVLSASSTHIVRLFGGAASIDSAFVMRDIPHTWTPCGQEELGAPSVSGPALRSRGLAA